MRVFNLKKNTICGTVNCADIIVYVYLSRVTGPRWVEVSWRRVLIVFHLRKPTPRTTNVSYNVGWISQRIIFRVILLKYLCSGSDIIFRMQKCGKTLQLMARRSSSIAVSH